MRRCGDRLYLDLRSGVSALRLPQKGYTLLEPSVPDRSEYQMRRSLFRLALRGSTVGAGKLWESPWIVRYPQLALIPHVGDPGRSWGAANRSHGRRVIFTRRLVFPSPQRK